MADVVVSFNGWGNYAWGQQAWGETYYTDGLVTTSLGSVIATTSVAIPVAGFGMVATLGDEATKGDFTFLAAGFGMDAEAGTAKGIPGSYFVASGLQALSALGTVGTNTSEHLIGLSLTATVGSVKTIPWSVLPTPNANWTPLPVPPPDIWSPVTTPAPEIWTPVEDQYA